MTNEEEDAEFLAHYGVKGMKWGDAARNAQAVIERNAELAKQGLDAAGNAIGSAVDDLGKGIVKDQDSRRKVQSVKDERGRKNAIKNGGNDTHGPDGTKRGFLDTERRVSSLEKGKFKLKEKTNTQGKAGRFIDSFFDKSVTRRIPRKGNVTTVEKGKINKFLAKNFSSESTSSSSSWLTDGKRSKDGSSSGLSLTKDYRFDRTSPRLKLTRKSKDTSWKSKN